MEKTDGRWSGAEGSTQLFDHHAPNRADTMKSRSAELREHCPVMRSQAYGGFWVLSRYQDVLRALKEHRTFSSESGVAIPGLVYPVPFVPTESDEPDHAHYRRVLWPFLTPGAVATYEPLIRQSVTELINEFIETGQANVMLQLAKPLPARVTGVFLGFSAEEGCHIYDLKETVRRAGSGGDSEEADAAAKEVFAILQTALDKARERPTNDVSSAIVTYDYEGKTFTNDECLGILNQAYGGALATTVGAIGHAIHLLWQYPEQRSRLIEAPEFVPNAVEEVLRMHAPTPAAARTLTEPCEVAYGNTLEQGERVLLLLDSANHDSATFDDPEQFKVDRSNNHHLSFGYGIHKCEGQHLARLELRVLLEEFPPSHSRL